ncbi:MAG: hypothetical protein QM764_04305 [Chitinophagaceae bacterium]
MKLAPLLARYLNTNKKLTLRGIGIFQSNPSPYTETSSSKNSKIPAEEITFTSDPSANDDDDLIKFISSETGKMKALAISDIESYIELLRQFLNIGKPFQIDGIGTLVKIKSGVYEFTSGQLLNEKITEPAVKELASTSINDESLSGLKTLYPKHSTAGFTIKKSVIAFMLFGGIGFAVWGGYILYNKNRGAVAENTATKNIVPIETAVVPASETKPAADTVKKIVSAPVTSAPGYKFVFESTHSKKRAIKRINILKQINSNIQLETVDSSLFNITVNLNIPATDTTRVKDSLNNWYYGKKDMLVKIASPNALANNP